MSDKLFEQVKTAFLGEGRIVSLGHWGRFPTFQAKIGTGPSAVIIVKRVRKFYAKQHIQFADVCDLQGMCVGCTPRWRGGYITKVEADRIYLDLM